MCNICLGFCQLFDRVFHFKVDSKHAWAAWLVFWMYFHQRVEGQGINSLTHFLIFQQTFWFSTFRSIYHDISNSIPTTALIRTKKKLSNNQLSNTAQDHKSIIKVQYLLMNKLDTKQIAHW